MTTLKWKEPKHFVKMWMFVLRTSFDEGPEPTKKKDIA
jgi:hypothetical protein